MKAKKLMLVVLLIMMILTSADALAYIDPGTGAVIIGSIWPLIVAFFSAMVAFLLKIFWKPIKKRISKLLRFKKKKE